MIEGKRRYPIKLFGLSLIPNHFHSIIEPEEDGALSSYVQWVEGGYCSYFRFVTNTIGAGHVLPRSLLEQRHREQRTLHDCAQIR